MVCYCISSVIRQIFFLPKQSQRSRSVLPDGSGSLGLFRKGKIGIIAKFRRTAGCPRSGKKSGKKIFFQGQGIVREF